MHLYWRNNYLLLWYLSEVWEENIMDEVIEQFQKDNRTKCVEVILLGDNGSIRRLLLKNPKVERFHKSLGKKDG